MIKNETYRIAYDFHQKWSPFPKSAEDWAVASDEMRDIVIQHNDLLLNSLLIAIFDDFEREYKKSPQQKD